MTRPRTNARIAMPPSPLPPLLSRANTGSGPFGENTYLDLDTLMESFRQLRRQTWTRYPGNSRELLRGRFGTWTPETPEPHRHARPRSYFCDVPPRLDATYDALTQGRVTAPIHYGGGQILPLHSILVHYRPAREIPLNSNEACRCHHFDFEVAPHRLVRGSNYSDWGDRTRLSFYQTAMTNMARLEALGTEGRFDTWGNRELVEQRQSRATAGMDTSEYDLEITRRVLRHPREWGWVGSIMEERGWVDEMVREGIDYQLR